MGGVIVGLGFPRVTRQKLEFADSPHSKAAVLTLGCGEGKYSIYCRLPSKENGQLMLKRPRLWTFFLFYV